MSLDKIKELEKKKGLNLVELVEQVHAQNVGSLKAVKTLMRRCRTQAEREVVLDALPRKPIIELAARLKDYDRIQIAASVLWLYKEHAGEVNEILSWLKLPAVDDYLELKGLMQRWIIEEN
jgi:hypothetical protein